MMLEWAKEHKKGRKIFGELRIYEYVKNGAGDIFVVIPLKDIINKDMYGKTEDEQI